MINNTLKHYKKLSINIFKRINNYKIKSNNLNNHVIVEIIVLINKYK
jgi:hypothetical protein